jgi:WD40 repeat protein
MDDPVVLCGTYELSEQQRTGRLYLMQIQQQTKGGSDISEKEEGEQGTCPPVKIAPRSCFVFSGGIFDVKWRENVLSSESYNIACSLSTGTLDLLKADVEALKDEQEEDEEDETEKENKNDFLTRVECVNVKTKEEELGGECAMCLFTDQCKEMENLWACSRSDGHACLIDMDKNTKNAIRSWKAHDLEVWTISFGGSQHSSIGTDYDVVMTGADDGSLRAWDLRTDLTVPAWKNDREHGAGVCVVRTSPIDDNCIVTGCYDQFVRLWDKRKLSRPIKKKDLDGGVWRIKWDPLMPSHFAAACMHAGFAYVSTTGDDLEVIGRYGEQTSLAYDVDILRSSDEKESRECGKVMFASSSFYDKSFHAWSVRTK